MTNTCEATSQNEWDHTAKHDLSEAEGVLEELRETWRLMKEERQRRVELSEQHIDFTRMSSLPT